MWNLSTNHTPKWKTTSLTWDATYPSLEEGSHITPHKIAEQGYFLYVKSFSVGLIFAYKHWTWTFYYKQTNYFNALYPFIFVFLSLRYACLRLTDRKFPQKTPYSTLFEVVKELIVERYNSFFNIIVQRNQITVKNYLSIR